MGLSGKQKEFMNNTSILMFGGSHCGFKFRSTTQKIFIIKRTKLLQSKSKCPRIVRVVIK